MVMHKKAGRRLGRTSSHRQRMTRNLVRSLFTYGRVVTTLDRAKDIRRTAEKIITLAKRGGLHNYRRIVDFVGDREVAKKVTTDVVARFKERKGGYTRIIRMGGCRWDGEGRGKYAATRLGDNGQRVYFELVERKDQEEEMLLAGRGIRAREQMADKRKAKKTAKEEKTKGKAKAKK